MAVGFALAKVFNHGQAHGFRCTVTKQARIAYVQGNDFITLPFKRYGAGGQFAADLIANTLENMVCLNWCFWHVSVSFIPSWWGVQYQ